MNILTRALEFIKLNQDFKLHFISQSPHSSMLEFLLKYNSIHLNYDYVVIYDGEIESHSGIRGPSRGMNASGFLGESQNDTFLLIELITPQNRKQILYTPRTRTLPAPRPRRN